MSEEKTSNGFGWKFYVITAIIGVTTLVLSIYFMSGYLHHRTDPMVQDMIAGWEKSEDCEHLIMMLGMVNGKSSSVLLLHPEIKPVLENRIAELGCK